MAPIHTNLVIATKSWNLKPTQEKEIILINQVPILLSCFWVEYEYFTGMRSDQPDYHTTFGHK